MNKAAFLLENRKTIAVYAMNNEKDEHRRDIDNRVSDINIKDLGLTTRL